jgi:hypothetical protein
MTRSLRASLINGSCDRPDLISLKFDNLGQKVELATTNALNAIARFYLVLEAIAELLGILDGKRLIIDF